VVTHYFQNFQMSIIMNASSMLSGDSRMIAVKIAPKLADDVVRRSFHLALLLDTSGSMECGGLPAVIRTLHLLIDALADSDKLTFIGYQSTATMIANSIVINNENRRVLHSAADGLVANGGTNLEDALAMLGTVSDIDAAFIMTDGHVNQGITSGAGLLRILGSSVSAGVPVNTLGYGPDHNSRLLRDMAVRSRGSYTFADADELLPAIIGDIMGGLANEVGRCGVLTIPAGWTCMELGCSESDTSYCVGTLIADKEQWIVLRAPATTELPTLNFQYRVGSEEHAVACTLDTSIPKSSIAEQMCRARVAVVFGAATDLLEEQNMEAAKAALEALGTELDASVAKTSLFVIKLRAQIDDMLEALIGRNSSWSPMPGHLSPPSLSPRFGAMLSSPPNLAPVLSRMASNTAALGLQRGFVSGLRAPVGTPSLDTRAHGGLEHTFSSPAQRNVTQRMTAGFSQAVSDSQESV
jgi:hypothetical protein